MARSTKVNNIPALQWRAVRGTFDAIESFSSIDGRRRVVKFVGIHSAPAHVQRERFLKRHKKELAQPPEKAVDW